MARPKKQAAVDSLLQETNAESLHAARVQQILSAYDKHQKMQQQAAQEVMRESTAYPSDVPDTPYVQWKSGRLILRSELQKYASGELKMMLPDAEPYEVANLQHYHQHFSSGGWVVELHEGRLMCVIGRGR